MILVTGGAGFIGSNLQAALFARGSATAVADRLGQDGRWRNLQKHPPLMLVPPETLEAWLTSAAPPLSGLPLSAIVHLGAISDTTVTDADLAWQTNVALSWRLWSYAARMSIPFLYASSAATYGDGALGFDDDGTLDHLQRLRPLNLYGWTKHVFDLHVAGAVAAGQATPPRWAGLKFFNVYGPNEYHKVHMQSVVRVKHAELAAGQAPALFRSDRADLADGAQARDFVWIGDVVEVMLWWLDTPDAASGLYNIGSGRARTYQDLAHAVCDAAGRPRAIRFIDMPDKLRGQYQSFTEAPLGRLRAAGYAGSFTSLETGITQYVRDYLEAADPYR